jgi:hypothetical protein
MSFIGEYIETPYLQHQREGDPYLREFKAVKHFPALRASLNRSSENQISSEKTYKVAQVVASRSKLKFPPTQRSIQESFRRSVLTEDPIEGSLSAFKRSLISERLKAKEKQLAKERVGLKVGSATLEREARLTDPDVTSRALAKVEDLAQGFQTDEAFTRIMLSGFSGRKVSFINAFSFFIVSLSCYS